LLTPSVLHWSLVLPLSLNCEILVLSDGCYDRLESLLFNPSARLWCVLEFQRCRYAQEIYWSPLYGFARGWNSYI
jgi:hypothetical protein